MRCTGPLGSWIFLSLFSQQACSLTPCTSASDCASDELNEWITLTYRLAQKNAFPKRTGRRNESAPLTKNLIWRRTFRIHILKERSRYNRRATFFCAELGYGPNLRKWFGDICPVGRRVYFDKFADEHVHAAIPLDLSKDLDKKTRPMKTLYADLVVTDNTFEHIERPQAAIATANTVLKMGGSLIFAMPFLTRSHGSFHGFLDYHRFTVHQLRRVLHCAGFVLKLLQGCGSMLSVLYSAAGIAYGRMVRSLGTDIVDAQSILSQCCDAIVNENGCANAYYDHVYAIGIKIRDNVTSESMSKCL